MGKIHYLDFKGVQFIIPTIIELSRGGVRAPLCSARNELRWKSQMSLAISVLCGRLMLLNGCVNILRMPPQKVFSSIGTLWKTSAVCRSNHLKCRVMPRPRPLARFPSSVYFFPLRLGFLYILTWSGVPPDMSDDQTLSVCGWFIFNEKTLWSGLRAASNAHHLQITMMKHSNGTDSYPQSSHTFRLHASNSWMDLE